MGTIEKAMRTTEKTMGTIEKTMGTIENTMGTIGKTMGTIGSATQNSCTYDMWHFHGQTLTKITKTCAQKRNVTSQVNVRQDFWKEISRNRKILII